MGKRLPDQILQMMIYYEHLVFGKLRENYVYRYLCDDNGCTNQINKLKNDPQETIESTDKS